MSTQAGTGAGPLRSEQQDQALLDLELLAESEWWPDGVQYDFEKLVAGRARHGLMIISQKTKTLARTDTNRLIVEIQNFRLTRPADSNTVVRTAECGGTVSGR